MVADKLVEVEVTETYEKNDESEMIDWRLVALLALSLAFAAGACCGALCCTCTCQAWQGAVSVLM